MLVNKYFFIILNKSKNIIVLSIVLGFLLPFFFKPFSYYYQRIEIHPNLSSIYQLEGIENFINLGEIYSKILLDYQFHGNEIINSNCYSPNNFYKKNIVRDIYLADSKIVINLLSSTSTKVIDECSISIEEKIREITAVSALKFKDYLIRHKSILDDEIAGINKKNIKLQKSVYSSLIKDEFETRTKINLLKELNNNLFYFNKSKIEFNETAALLNSIGSALIFLVLSVFLVYLISAIKYRIK